MATQHDLNLVVHIKADAAQAEATIKRLESLGKGGTATREDTAKGISTEIAQLRKLADEKLKAYKSGSQTGGVAPSEGEFKAARETANKAIRTFLRNTLKSLDTELASMVEAEVGTARRQQKYYKQPGFAPPPAPTSVRGISEEAARRQKAFDADESTFKAVGDKAGVARTRKFARENINKYLSDQLKGLDEEAQAAVTQQVGGKKKRQDYYSAADRKLSAEEAQKLRDSPRDFSAATVGNATKVVEGETRKTAASSADKNYVAAMLALEVELKKFQATMERARLGSSEFATEVVAAATAHRQFAAKIHTAVTAEADYVKATVELAASRRQAKTQTTLGLHGETGAGLTPQQQKDRAAELTRRDTTTTRTRQTGAVSDTEVSELAALKTERAKLLARIREQEIAASGHLKAEAEARTLVEQTNLLLREEQLQSKEYVKLLADKKALAQRTKDAVAAETQARGGVPESGALAGQGSGKPAGAYQKFKATVSSSGKPAEEQPTLLQDLGTRAMSSAQFALGGLASGALIFGLIDAVKQASLLQEQFAGLRGQIEVLGQAGQFGQIKDVIKGISNETGIAASEVTKFTARLIGIFDDPKQALAETESAMKLAVVSGTDLNTMMEELVPVARTFGVSIEQIGDLAVRIHDKFGIAEEQTLHFLGSTAAAAEAAGYSLTELGIIGGTAANVVGNSLTVSGEQFSKVIETISGNQDKIAAVYQRNEKTAPLADPILEAFGRGDGGEAFKLMLGSYNKLDHVQQNNLIRMSGSRREYALLNGLFGRSTELLGELNSAEVETGNASGGLEKRFQSVSATLQQTFERVHEAIKNLVEGLLSSGLGTGLNFVVWSFEQIFKVGNIVVEVFNRINDAMKFGPFDGGLLAFIASIAGAIFLATKAWAAYNAIKSASALVSSAVKAATEREAVAKAGSAAATAVDSEATVVNTGMKQAQARAAAAASLNRGRGGFLGSIGAAPLTGYGKAQEAARIEQLTARANAPKSAAEKAYEQSLLTNRPPPPPPPPPPLPPPPLPQRPRPGTPPRPGATAAETAARDAEAAAAKSGVTGAERQAEQEAQRLAAIKATAAGAEKAGIGAGETAVGAGTFAATTKLLTGASTKLKSAGSALKGSLTSGGRAATAAAHQAEVAAATAKAAQVASTAEAAALAEGATAAEAAAAGSAAAAGITIPGAAVGAVTLTGGMAAAGVVGGLLATNWARDMAVGGDQGPLSFLSSGLEGKSQALAEEATRMSTAEVDRRAVDQRNLASRSVDRFQEAFFDLPLGNTIYERESNRRVGELGVKTIKGLEASGKLGEFTQQISEPNLELLNTFLGQNDETEDFGKDQGIVGADGKIDRKKLEENLPKIREMAEGENASPIANALVAGVDEIVHKQGNLKPLSAAIETALREGSATDKDAAIEAAGGLDPFLQAQYDPKGALAIGAISPAHYLTQVKQNVANAKKTLAGTAKQDEAYTKLDAMLREGDKFADDLLTARVNNQTRIASYGSDAPKMEAYSRTLASLPKHTYLKQLEMVPDLQDKRQALFEEELSQIQDPTELRRRQAEGYRQDLDVRELDINSQIRESQPAESIFEDLTHAQPGGGEIGHLNPEVQARTMKIVVDEALRTGKSVKEVLRKKMQEVVDVFGPAGAVFEQSIIDQIDSGALDDIDSPEYIAAPQKRSDREAVDHRLKSTEAKIAIAKAAGSQGRGVQADLGLQSANDKLKALLDKQAIGGAGPDIQADIDAARADVFAAQRTVKDVVNDVAVAMLGWAVLANRGNPVKEAIANLAIANKQVAIVSERVHGRADDPDLIKANQDAERARIAIITAQRENVLAVMDWAIVNAKGDPVKEAQGQIDSATEVLNNALADAGGDETATPVIKARQNVARAEENAHQKQLDIQRSRFAVLLALDSRDPLKSAQIAQQQAQFELNNARGTADEGNKLAAKIAADKSLENAISEVFDSRANLAIALADIAGDPVKAAEIAEKEAKRKLNEARSRGITSEAVLHPLEQAFAQASEATAKAGRTNDEQITDFQLAMGQITTQAAIESLRLILGRTREGTEEYRSLALKIHQLEENAGQDNQFNLPSTLGLPTLYEARRMSQSTLAGIGYQDNRNVVLSVAVNGAQDPMAVTNQIMEAFSSALDTGNTYAPNTGVNW